LLLIVGGILCAATNIKFGQQISNLANNEVSKFGLVTVSFKLTQGSSS
jgi:hypothetical protein